MTFVCFPVVTLNQRQSIAPIIQLVCLLCLEKFFFPSLLQSFVIKYEPDWTMGELKFKIYFSCFILALETKTCF